MKWDFKVLSMKQINTVLLEGESPNIKIDIKII